MSAQKLHSGEGAGVCGEPPSNFTTHAALSTSLASVPDFVVSCLGLFLVRCVRALELPPLSHKTRGVRGGHNSRLCATCLSSSAPRCDPLCWESTPCVMHREFSLID